MIYPRISRRQIATALLASYLLGPVSAFAQVVLNAGTPNDGRRAYVDQTQNGLPKVNIATPNGAGVSHNVYQELNVGKQGLILNNAANNSNTSLAGWVEGNPNLKPGNEAKMILNEVVGANPSQLQGFVEVAGKKADVIITNENGVNCNGCGFINTSRVTLSTGTPMWGSTGQLDGLKVRQGSINIGGDGLSAPDSRVDLLSQAINIQGDVHADSLNAIAGGNDIRYGDLSRTKLPDIRGAMDIAALGGMYANQIQLVATGTGVGVRVDGTLVSAGNVSITSDGQLTHTGKTSAQNSIQVTAQQITQSGSLLAIGALDINAQSLTNTGTLVGQDQHIQAAQAILNQGKIGANGALTMISDSLNNSGQLNAKGTSQIATGALINAGEILTDAALTITASSLSNTAKISGNSVTATVTGALDNASTASLSAVQDLTLQANAINNAGSVSANRSIALEADKLVQNGTLVSKGTLTASQLSSLENSGTLSGQTLDVTADKVLNLGAGTLASNAAATIHATTLNNLGRIHTEGQATFDARRVNNAGVIEAVGGLSINQAWTVQNTGNLVGADVAINTQALNNSGRLQADQLTLSAYQDSGIPSADRLTQTAVVNSGVMAADRMAITGYASLTNTNQISTDITVASNATDSGNIRIQVDTLDNTGGSLLAKNKLTADGGNVYNNGATLSSKGDMRITASGNIDNGAGLILHQGSGSAQVQAGLALNNVKGQIEGQGQSLSVSAADIDNTQGQIVQTKASTSAQPASLNVSVQKVANTTSQGQLVNIKGNISSTGNTTITANNVVTDTSSAQLSGASSLSFLDKTKISSGASTATGGYNWNTDIAASNAVTQAQSAADQANAQAQAAATALQTAQTNFASVQANATSTPAAIAQAQSAVTTAQTANTAAQAAATTAAQQLATAKAAVPAINAGTTGSSITQSNGKPVDLTVPNAPAIVLSAPASQIQAGNDLTLNVGTALFDNHQGSLAAARNLTVTAQGDVLAGQMTAGGALSVTAKQLEVIQQIRGKTANVTANALMVTGRVQGDDSLNIKADSITNSGTLTGNAVVLQGRSSDTSLTLGNTGMVQGNQSLTIQADKVLNQATLVSGGDITTQTQYLENKALIYSGGNQNHYGVELVNNAGRLYAMGDITIQGNAAGDNAQSLLNYIGRIEAQGDINLKANTITNHAVVPTVNARGVVEKTVTSDKITTTAKDTFNADGKPSEILAGRNLNVKADTLLNEYGIISARLNANIGTRLLTNRAYGAIQTQNYVVKAACFNCHQTVSYSETWGGVIAAGGTATVTASEKLDNKTIDTRDGFAGLSTDPRVVIVDERSNTASPLTQAFKDRFGIVNGPANSAAGAAPSLNLGSPKALSDGLVLNPNGTFDFSHYTVPNGPTGLFEKAPATSPYLIRGRSDLFAPASNDQYTSYNKFAGSDYLLTRLGLMPGGIKLLGDAWYETQLVQDQMYALKGRTHLVAGTDNDYDLMMGLMDAGLLAQAQFGFGLGDTLTAEQQAALTKDMVWPEWQVVDGQKVLVPKLYVAHLDQNNDNNKGARIVGTDVAITTRELENTGTLAASKSLAINASGKVSGGGSYSGGKAVAIVADSVDLKSASIQSGGWLSLDTANDMSLTATQIKAAGDARLSAGGNIALNAEKHEAHIVRGDGSSKDEVRYETTNVQSGGNLTIEGTKGVLAQGSKLNAAGDFKLSSVQGNVDLQAVVNDEKISTRTYTENQTVQGVQINATGNALVQATQGNVTAQSLQMQAGQQAAVVAGGDVALTSAQAYSKVQNGNDIKQSLVTERSKITADQGVTIYGQNSVQLDAASVKSAQGDTMVSSAGDVRLGFNTDTQQRDWTTSSSSSSWGGFKRSTTTTQHETLDKTAQATEIEGQNIRVLGNNVKSEAAKLGGAQQVQVEGVNNTQLYAAQEVHETTQNSQTSSSLIGITYSKSNSTDSNIKSEALGTQLNSDKAIQIGVGAVTDVQGAILNAPKVDFVRSAGADTSKAGQLILGASSNTTQTSHTEKTTTAGVYQEMSGQGETKQTLSQTQINGKVNIATGINTLVMIPEGDLKTQVQSLSQQPGLAYIAGLAKDPKVNWQQVKLAYDKWEYNQEGLTPAGAAILAIVIAVATSGAGAEASAAVMTEAEAAAAMAEAQAAAAAAGASTTGITAAQAAALAAPMQTAIFQAGIATLASQSGVSLVNNKGDLGKTLKDMGSKDSVKNVVLAMASAGALQGLSQTLTIDGQKLSQINAKDSTFAANLSKNVVNSLANATMTSAITGTSLEDNIKTGLVGALISAGSAQGANTIGDMTANDQMAKALAHAIAGCMAGAAGQGKGGCSAGSTGAVVGELAAQWYDPNGTKKPEDTLNFVRVISAAAGALTGDGSAASVATASMTGVNAAQNNYLNHTQWKEFSDKLSSCKGETGCEGKVRQDYVQLSKLQDAELATCDKRGDCATLKTDVVQGREAMLALVNQGKLPDAYAGALDMQYMGQRLATDATFRKQVANSVEYMNWCSTNASACNKDQLQKAMGMSTLVLGPVIAANPQLVAAVLLAQNGERAGSAVIGGGVNAIAQGLSSGQINSMDVPKAAATAYATSGASLTTTTAVNVGAEGATSWVRDESQAEALSKMLLTAVGTGIGYKATDLSKNQVAGITNSFSNTIASKPTGFLTIEGPYSQSLLPSSVGAGVGSVIGEKISSYGDEVKVFLQQFTQ